MSKIPYGKKKISSFEDEEGLYENKSLQKKKKTFLNDNKILPVKNVKKPVVKKDSNKLSEKDNKPTQNKKNTTPSKNEVKTDVKSENIFSENYKKLFGLS